MKHKSIWAYALCIPGGLLIGASIGDGTLQLIAGILGMILVYFGGVCNGESNYEGS